MCICRQILLPWTGVTVLRSSYSLLNQHASFCFFIAPETKTMYTQLAQKDKDVTANAIYCSKNI